jgi:copper transport protein
MPAGAAYRPGQERSVQAGPITLELTALNSAPRTLEVHLYAFGTDGRPADVTDIRAEAAQTGNGGLGPVTIPLLHAGTGHFLSGELLLPHAGSWTLTLVVHTGKFDADTATTTLKVR